MQLSEWLSQVGKCGSGHVPADTTMTPPGLRPPLKDHCLAAASTQTNPASPQAIKGCMLFLAMQMLQPLKKVTALTTTLGHSLWVSCLGKGGIFQSSLCLNEEKAGILSLTNAPPISAITAAELSNLFLSPRKSACLDTKPLRDGEPHTTSTNTLFQCMPAPPVQRASFFIYICQA